ncbi:MAG TPA: HAD family acid phosphatase [Baekduia sp.]|uniref:HAD family acid phosphatase n=1 Tax=Baekduia sp. TaxID=2600305 RepID=UPI002B8E3D9B|nr:HAD family acid phosphatase [Baekduia sp.]HMJ34592.1 HAD family acid phosphatase [Baekduia sp.]
MTRLSLRALALAAVLALVLAAVASAATVRTSATPAQLRAGKVAYDKAITAGFAKATKQLDAQLKKHPKKPTVVLDIDETTMSNWTCLDAVDFDLIGIANCVVGGTSVAYPAAKAFIKHARARKVAIAFVTGAPQLVCAGRRQNLVAQGITAPFTLACRPADDHADTLVPYKSKARKALQKAGATIVLNVGDQQSDLAGGAARATVKLPNPVYTSA